MKNSDYVDEVLDRFIDRHEGQYLDHSHAYGPQSPDLIEYYLTDLLGRPWQFRAGAASNLWSDHAVDMDDFVKVGRDEPLRKGDVLVFDAPAGGFGTVGIYVSPGSRVGSVNMFTQNPGPAKVVDILRDGTLNRMLGAWRLSYGAECKIIADKFAEQLHDRGRWPRDLQREINDADLRAHDAEIDAAFERGFEQAKTLPSKKRAAVEAWLHQQQADGKKPGTLPAQQVIETTTPAEPLFPHWMKDLATRDPKPGDVIVWGDYPGSPSYGHTTIVGAKQARHYRRQTWIARLKTLFGRGPK